MGAQKKRLPGISRIDQREKRTHGFFVRLTRKGKIYNAFFADKSYGGKNKALDAAQKHYRKLLREHGRISRRDRAQIKRRVGASGIMGVRKAVLASGKRKLTYWLASWSPHPHVVQRRMFSVQKYGPAKARAMAVQARRTGVRNMED